MTTLTQELNPVKWTTEERRQFLDRGFRSRRAGEFPVSALARPDDYDNDLKRGTIEYIPGWLNYSFQTVVVPDGAVLHNCNFTQNQPATVGIIGVDLTLIDCNLVNCALDPSWTVRGCNTVQAWLELDEKGQETRVAVASHPDQLAKDAAIPPTAILSRDF